MIGDLERRLVELRFLEGIEKVEHVPYQTGDQFWVRFNRPLDFDRLDEIVKKHSYLMVRFASILSKLPRGLAEMLWDGVTHIIVKEISGWSKFTSSLGFEPEGIAKIAIDLHGQYQIFMATNEDGVQVLYEYLGLKYVAPAPPPPKPAAPAKPAPVVAKPVPPAAPKPTAPMAAAAASQSAAGQATQPEAVLPQEPAKLVTAPTKGTDTTQVQPKKETAAQATS